MFQFSYRISVEILKPRNEVIKTLFDYEQFNQYQQPYFDHFEILSGPLLSTGAVVNLYYKYKDQVITLKEETALVNLPDEITQIYHLGEVKNTCHSNFKENKLGTLWMMDVTFRFPTNEKQDEKYFMKKTEEDMITFKKYVESL